MVRLLRYFPTALILGLGLVLTLAATAWVERWERLSRQSEFQKQTNNLTTALQRTTNRYTELLLSISDLYDAANNEVDDAAFRRFVNRAVTTYPGIQALEWAPQVTQPERANYEQQLSQLTDGDRTFITERDEQTGQLIPAEQRDRYVPVTFLEPIPSNEPALGYDLASDETRRIALEQARDTGAIAATGRIQLVQETNENQYGFLVFAPIYEAPTVSLADRQSKILGYVLGVFRVADVVEESLRDLDYDIDFYILDQTAQPSEQLLGVYQTASRSVSAEPQKITILETNSALCAVPADCIQTIQLGQREWQIVFVPSSMQTFLWGTVATLVIGLLLTATVLIYVARWQSELQRTRELSDLKLRLFSMASHELRTPLSIISVSAQSLAANLNELSPEKRASSLDRIQVAAQRMGKLVNDMLTLTRAEAGKLEFNPEIIALEPFCQQLYEQIHLKAGQTLLRAGNATHSQIFADKSLLSSILLNLLSNAAKYSPEHSSIRLMIHQEKTAVCFQVVDQGIGILPEERSAILDAFYRGENVGAVSGTGLGLAVVKTCVDIHQGTLAIASNADGGTTVTVWLPQVE
ncbi:CHASE domain-containing sensor histidine kinase [Leptolyngbya iicbica]|uniref:histidine kinase n=2 Tax=Cyanophyceae TaxID=3028117 RepID=A0A4Q7EG36_9CYAN|nr:CHASE domain-containing protein [Leptolyngbya sp. LK]RZM82222.1 histidine kinase [Leptolyngbya sp. LK]